MSLIEQVFSRHVPGGLVDFSRESVICVHDRMVQGWVSWGIDIFQGTMFDGFVALT
jgi:hypothetical protein